MIEVSDLSVRYRDARNWAVENVSFAVETGVAAGLIGPNGAGKSTVLRSLASLLRPSRGRVSVDGFDSVRDSVEVRKRVGFLTSHGRLYQNLTCLETFRLFGQLHQIPRQNVTARIAELTERFSLDTFLQKRTGQLSTGQQQRVSLALALLHRPRFLILDEPTTGLDIEGVQTLTASLREVVGQGVSVLFSSHDLHTIERLCSVVLVLKGGHLVASRSLAHPGEGGSALSLEDWLHTITGVGTKDPEETTPCCQ